MQWNSSVQQVNQLSDKPRSQSTGSSINDKSVFTENTETDWTGLTPTLTLVHIHQQISPVQRVLQVNAQNYNEDVN